MSCISSFKWEALAFRRSIVLVATGDSLSFGGGGGELVESASFFFIPAICCSMSEKMPQIS
jgi:hypothetical protein